jgi:putative CocE/NonD family hydrolase
MQRALSAFLCIVLASAVFGGCIDETKTQGTTLQQAAGEKVQRKPAEGLNTTGLTKPVYQMLPKVRGYVTATVDKVRLYVEVFRPDGPGPWPTILINSPYYDHGVSGSLDVESAFRIYFVPRGYTVVVADVRGTGYSEGCMNMMGAKEQKDTYDLVEWIAAQPWSDGKVGMYGVSYVGTTPHEALIMAPPHLVTVVTVAGVTNQWRNMFLNGVPYSNRFYPLTYEATEGLPPPGDLERGPDWARNAAAGGCEQEDAVRSYSPGVYEKGVYDKYWQERNFTLKVQDIKASILYNEGFTDRAVNPMESIYWYNEIPTPKKSLWGQWPHATPKRADWQDTLNAWFDHWLKGMENGVMDTPPVEVVLNTKQIRTGTEWPPKDAAPMRLFLAPGSLSPEPPAASKATYMQDPAYRGGTDEDAVASNVKPMGPTWLNFQTAPLEKDVHLAGLPWAHLRASVDADNTYFLLDLYDVQGSTWTPITEGWMNAHLWQSFDKSSPLTPNKEYAFHFKFEPREYVFLKGHQIGVKIKGHDGRVLPFDKPMTHNTVYFGGADPSYVELPVLESPVVYPCPPDFCR